MEIQNGEAAVLLHSNKALIMKKRMVTRKFK